MHKFWPSSLNAVSPSHLEAISCLQTPMMFSVWTSGGLLAGEISDISLFTEINRGLLKRLENLLQLFQKGPLVTFQIQVMLLLFYDHESERVAVTGQSCFKRLFTMYSLFTMSHTGSVCCPIVFVPVHSYWNVLQGTLQPQRSCLSWDSSSWPGWPLTEVYGQHIDVKQLYMLVL